MFRKETNCSCLKTIKYIKISSIVYNLTSSVKYILVNKISNYFKLSHLLRKYDLYTRVKSFNISVDFKIPVDTQLSLQAIKCFQTFIK